MKCFLLNKELKRKELGIKVEFKNFCQEEKEYQKIKRLKYEEKILI